MIRVLITDDEALVRGGLRIILEAQSDVDVDVDIVGEASDCRVALTSSSLPTSRPAARSPAPDRRRALQRRDSCRLVLSGSTVKTHVNHILNQAAAT
jgi:DNA-binding NarL/FixJ family response regulator